MTDLILLRLDPPAEGDWWDWASCVETDPDAFFPEAGGSPREAKQVCRDCPVQPECLEYAMKNGLRHGVWGGLTEYQRRQLSQERKAAA